MLLLRESEGSLPLERRFKVLLPTDVDLIEVDLVGGAGAFFSSLNSAAVFLLWRYVAAGMVALVAEFLSKLDIGVVSPEDLEEELRLREDWETNGERPDTLVLGVRFTVALVLEVSLPILLLEA